MVCEWGETEPWREEGETWRIRPRSLCPLLGHSLKTVGCPSGCPMERLQPRAQERGAGIAQRVSWGILARFIPLQQVRFTSWHRPASQPSRLLWHTYFRGSIETQPHTGLFLRRERLHAPPPRLQRKHSRRLSSGAADFELWGSKRDSFPNQKARILHRGLTGADPGNPYRFQ
jgi:hypothetical protein